MLRTWRIPTCSRILSQSRTTTQLARYATASAQQPNQAIQIFDREAKRKQRNRAARHPESREVDYLKDEVAERLSDRLLDVKRRFNKVVDLGSGAGHIIKFLDDDMLGELIQFDMSRDLLYRDADKTYNVPTSRIVGDEERLPFEENSLDAVVSNLSLHWINDLPGTLIQVRRALKPDGMFLGAMFGGDTLYELRTALQLAEIEREGGLAPHVSPMTAMKDVGSLLSRAGLTLTTVDVDEIVVNYPSMFELMSDLRAMGESNAIASRKPYLKRDTLAAAAAIYKEVYGNEDGSVPATFQVIYMIGWKPDPSQPKPAKRGSGEVSLKTLEEVKAVGGDIVPDGPDAVILKMPQQKKD